MYELILTPENIIREAGLRPAHALARDIVLRGAMRFRKPLLSS
jgi:hypothetical protein